MIDTVKQSSGQTMIEVMMTVLLMGIGIIGLIRFQNYLAYDTSSARIRSDAIIVAVNQIETLRDFQVINNQAGYSSYQQIASGSSTVAGLGVSYAVSWTVTAFTNPTYKTINVTVSWTDNYNVTQSVNLVTSVGSLDPVTSAIIM